MKHAATQLSRIFATLSTATLLGCGGGATTNTNLEIVNPAEPVSDWQLVWSDEFDGTSIDAKKWTHEVNCAGGGNNESQCYTDSADNSFIANGTLNIVALPAEEGAEKPYTSARLQTRYKADFQYGRIEMRAKLPSGQGSWPAFWMMPTDELYGGWPKSGEIDIMEAVNLKAYAADLDAPETRIYGTLHYGSGPDAQGHKITGKAYTPATNPADDFHTYAIEWQEGEIRWYMDGYLYATQRQSEVRYNSKGEASGLAHRGWFAEYFDQASGELTTHWDSAPFDQDFYLILNLAVGGDWPINVNETGIDADAFAQGQSFEIDYVRVYECSVDPMTGKGCETIRPGYASYDDALLEGAAPIPSPPSVGGATNLTIFDGAVNPSWPAWDCCGGSTPALVTDAEQGEVVEFSIGGAPTVMGFISRSAFITDPEAQPAPFDGSGMLEKGSIKFDMKVVSAPNDPSSVWKFKVESSEGATAVELDLSAGYVGPSAKGAVMPETGVWEHYEFSLQMLADAGLDVSAIDVIMIFPAWGTGDGAVYRVANVAISQESPSLVLFEDGMNPDWPMWDCCGGSTPVEAQDDEAHGLTAEFSIGANPTVMGFITRPDNGGGNKPFDATSIIENGVIQFEMRAVSLPNNAAAPWFFKVESDNAASAVELPLTASVEGHSPVAGEWQTYTFKLTDLIAAGLDVTAIDVIMVFPGWGQGEGAVYRIDNAKIYETAPSFTLFDEAARDGWVIWDCCGGSTPAIVAADEAHGNVAEFAIGAAPTVMGIITRSAVGGGDAPIDATALLDGGVVRFDMKVVSAPNNASAPWLLKIESDGGATAVEVNLNTSAEGADPVTGEWQTYTFSLSALAAAGLDVTAIDVIMVFPAWGTGEGAVYQIDNMAIAPF
ncbi:glycoside hydrolase family 16 protein [Bowmanella sp. JS7-9]|uniref:Family 16 glycosylhydrolase n=1 Tax=Pseudobowmanella zhangzhouensis TaxID=1537679 RepID=A0ABW1XL01_9ALTE|nr:glycoside hydrolase family 16 protein [Bowmanella sp. JS7-9]TBX25772.1 glycosyl hydrolase family 16 [Bowmanella sp. JS7-9]